MVKKYKYNKKNIKRLLKNLKNKNKDYDYVVVIDGEERCGMSVLSMPLVEYLDSK